MRAEKVGAICGASLHYYHDQRTVVLKTEGFPGDLVFSRDDWHALVESWRRFADAGSCVGADMRVFKSRLDSW